MTGGSQIPVPHMPERSSLEMVEKEGGKTVWQVVKDGNLVRKFSRLFWPVFFADFSPIFFCPIFLPIFGPYFFVPGEGVQGGGDPVHHLLQVSPIQI